MDEKEFNLARDRFDLVATETYKKIRENQLNMIVDFSKSNCEPLELRGMLRLIGKTDDWRDDFIKIKSKR